MTDDSPTDDSTIDTGVLAAARTGAVLCDTSDDGHLLLRGDEHLDYLHRLSTNDTRTCAVGAGLRTVFCDSKGRIVDLARLCRRDATTTDLFVSPGRGPAMCEWLERFHFGEAIEWEEITSTRTQVDLVGPAVAAVAADVLGLDVAGFDDGDRVPHEALLALRLDAGGHAGLRLWGELHETVAALRRAGVAVADEATRQVLRLEFGQPGPAELTLEHNPWEAGLADAIHMNKGCYTGQEVIARLDTYDKVKQRLVGLRLSAPVTAGAPVLHDGRDVGGVTSVADSPALGAIALAYVRNVAVAPGTTVEVGDAGVTATVSDLPFRVE
jgi:folate-binding protein YgfZ